MARTRLKPMHQMDEAGSHFAMQMGNCLAQWSYIEDYFFLICHAALQCPKQQAAIVYYKTPNFDARMTLTDELVKSTLPQHAPGEHPHEDLKAWIAAYKGVDKIKPIRNRIAHCQMGPQPSALVAHSRGEEVKLESWFVLYESNNEKMRGRPLPSPLTMQDLSDYLVASNRAQMPLHRFYHEILGAHVPIPPPR
jgi:hypothetical protein